ncbi:MAG TPA: arsenosugar biosynthesis radical SAM (seleno)protein ArsS [Nitrospirota bacterium]|nr:arsenosugar biosynthesis radical SAM (seleno)protein ArsS [Nitrospirota bacterium]
MVGTKFNDKLLTLQSGPLKALDMKVLQVNLGYRCNMACKHCHVSAGPARAEDMDATTAEKVLRVFLDNPFEIMDLTGGAPELNPSFPMLVTGARNAGRRVIARTNLTIFFEEGMGHLPRFYRDRDVELIASLPYYLEDGVDRVRGGGTFRKSIEALRTLNALGYGMESAGPSLSLVYNPQGMFLASAQCSLEAEYKRELKDRFNVSFTRLYTFTNMPIGRFRDFLVRTGNLEKYLNKLSAAFNPGTLDGIMCRHLVNVGWDGSLFDCDFNQILGQKTVADVPRHIDRFDFAALAERAVAVDDHCYGCTAGQGSS